MPKRDYENEAISLVGGWRIGLEEDVLNYIAEQQPLVAAYMALALLCYLTYDEGPDAGDKLLVALGDRVGDRIGARIPESWKVPEGPVRPPTELHLHLAGLASYLAASITSMEFTADQGDAELDRIVGEVKLRLRQIHNLVGKSNRDEQHTH